MTIINVYAMIIIIMKRASFGIFQSRTESRETNYVQIGAFSKRFYLSKALYSQFHRNILQWSSSRTKMFLKKWVNWLKLSSKIVDCVWFFILALNFTNYVYIANFFVQCYRLQGSCLKSKIRSSCFYVNYGNNLYNCVSISLILPKNWLTF